MRVFRVHGVEWESNLILRNCLRSLRLLFFYSIYWKGLVFGSALTTVTTIFTLSTLSPTTVTTGKSPRMLLAASTNGVRLRLSGRGTPISIRGFISCIGDNFCGGAAFRHIVPNFVVRNNNFARRVRRGGPGPPVGGRTSGNLHGAHNAVTVTHATSGSDTADRFFVGITSGTFLSRNRHSFNCTMFNGIIGNVSITSGVSRIPARSINPCRGIPSGPMIVLSTGILPW